MSDIASNTERQLTIDIVAAVARHNQVSADQLAGLISTVHQTLSDLGKPAEEVIERTPAVTIRRSVHRDYVTCIECGWRGSMLRRHVFSSHGLTPNAYRARWGLSLEHLLTAPAYSERRSIFAKQIGLGHRRKPRSRGTTQRAAKTASKPSGKRRAKALVKRNASAQRVARRRLKLA